MSMSKLVVASDIERDVTRGGVEKRPWILDRLVIVDGQIAGESRLRDVLWIGRAGAERGANVTAQVVPIALVQLF
jgi:hypothetical protein